MLGCAIMVLPVRESYARGSVDSAAKAETGGNAFAIPPTMGSLQVGLAG